MQQRASAGGGLGLPYAPDEAEMVSVQSTLCIYWTYGRTPACVVRVYPLDVLLPVRHTPPPQVYTVLCRHCIYTGHGPPCTVGGICSVCLTGRGVYNYAGG